MKPYYDNLQSLLERADEEHCERCVQDYSTELVGVLCYASALTYGSARRLRYVVRFETDRRMNPTLPGSSSETEGL